MKKFLLSLFAVLTATFAMAQTNLLKNGGFEEWTDDATPVSWKTESTAGNATLAKSTDSRSGNYSVEIKGKSSNVRLGYAEVTLNAGTYTFKIYAKAAADGAQARVGYVPIKEDGKAGTYTYAGEGPTALSTSEWIELTQEFTLTESTKLSLVLMNSKNGNGVSVLADDASLTTSDGGQGGGGGDEDQPDFSEYEELSVSAFLEKKDTKTKFKLTGVVGQIKNTTYGNFNLIDLDNEDVYVYVYGLVDYKGTKKIWGTLDPKIEEKDTITIVGSYTLYGESTDEIVDAIYVKHVKYTGDKVSIKNTPETAYTMAKVKELVDAGEGLGDEVYVKGIVSEVGTITAGGTGTYFIKDNLSDEFSVQVYNGNYLENHAFDTAEDIKVGDEVIVYGLITLYNTTYEVNTGNYIYSLNGKTKYEAKDLNDITNTPETAYTVSQAIALIDNAENDLTKEVYTKGVITSIKSIDVSTYERAQYYIGETVDAEQTIQVYNGYYLGEGVAFTDNEQIKVGDEVVVYGKLTKFKDTYEIDQNNYLYSLNGQTAVGIGQIVNGKSSDGAIYDLSGRRVEKAVKGIYIVNGKKFVK
ncbi:MAG: carbohydrate binding domain-containing protein [Bacteroidaceae bacterium]|nr:carbohydrate binding domain-containing protein [Bacteroidaceae bacterium]